MEVGQADQGRRKGGGAGLNGKIGAEDPAQLLGGGMDVDQGLAGFRQVDQLVALGGHLAQPRTDHQQQIGFPHPRQQLRVGSRAEIADPGGAVVVHHVLPAEGGADRDIVGFGEAAQVLARGIGPAAAARDYQGPVRQGQQLGGALEVRHAGVGLDLRIAAGRRDADTVAQHVFGKRQNDGTGPSGCRHMEGAADEFRDARRIVDLGRPFGDRREHAAVVDFLERLALGLIAGHLPHEQDHRRRVLHGGMNADGGVAGAGAARDEADAGPPGQLAGGLGHIGGPALVAAGDQLDIGGVMKGVQHIQITLARDAEGQSRRHGRAANRQGSAHRSGAWMCLT